MQISLFKSFPKAGQPHIASENTTIIDFLNKIKYGEWQKQVNQIRLEQDKKRRDEFKKQLPCVTISGTFVERNQNNLIQHSGFICIDIDHFTDKSELLKDQYTYACFRSASGGGLAIFVKINPEKHKESFKWLQNYYFQSFGIVVDSAPQNVASLRFASFDPEIYINEKSKTAKFLSDKPKKLPSLPVVLDDSEVSQMVKECLNLGIDLAPDYDTYYKLAFSLAEGFGENGRDWFYSLCSTSDKYDHRAASKQYDIALKGNKQGITVGTLYHYLKSVGINIPESSKKAVQVAAVGKKSGRSKEAVVNQLIEINGVNPDKAEKVAEEVFKRVDIDIKSAIENPAELVKAINEWLTQNYKLKKNSITGIIENNGIELKRERINTIYLEALCFFNSKSVTKELIETCIFSDFIYEYNPITDFINRNLHRRSRGNIDKLCQSINTNTRNYVTFIRKWYISIIAAYNGYPVRSVLALVGGQNTGKTEFFRRLLPPDLLKYYAESKLDAGKDDEILMCQKLVLMDDEMGGKSKSDEKRFKELTSKNIFSLRAPYGRNNEDFKRLAILCGTSNDPEIINDPTGNTRILPIEIISIDHDLYNSIDKNDLFMEAYFAYENGAEWQLCRDEIIELQGTSDEFRGTNIEKELLSKFFMPGHVEGFGEYLTSTEIKDYIETFTKQKIVSMKRFGAELRNFFGKPKSKRINGLPMYCYHLEKISIRSENDTTKSNESIF